MSVQKRLYKNSEEAKLAGVCQGIAEYFDIDPTIIRIIWALGTLSYGVGLIVYIVLWIVLPEKRDIMSKDVHHPEYTIRDEDVNTNTDNNKKGPDLSKKE